MEEIKFNREDIENNGIEISSVSVFIEKINELKANLNESSQELFFRGQKTDFWALTPSVFRDNLLSIEHTLMQLPLLKVPHEFVSINNDFERMTKYQHYGMCTRLLDLTTNPLVALFFACATYGQVHYKDDPNDTCQEANGVIFFNKRYSTPIDELNVKIVSALSQMDLSKDNTLGAILNNLVRQQIISKESADRWNSNSHYEEFIEIIQNNYIVIPPYNNERLSRQSGIFLLTGCFNFIYKTAINESIIEKGYKNLRDEFDEKFFYVSGENKEIILEELDTYNINEATLFPELEHHLNYIKNKKNALKTDSVQFKKYDFSDTLIATSDVDEITNDKIVTTESFKHEVMNMLGAKLDCDIQIIWGLVESWVSTIDWYKQESAKSRFKINVQKELLNKGISRENLKSQIDDIVDNIIKIAINLSKGSE
jgi:hypothetical protein